MFNTIRPLPSWLMKRYSVLWVKTKGKFDYDTAKKILNDKDEVLSVVLSNIRKLGWLEVKTNPRDSRKKIYHLKPPKKAIDEIVQGFARG